MTMPITEGEGDELARRFARVIVRMKAAHPATAGVVTSMGVSVLGLDPEWLTAMVPRLEREWAEKGE